MTNKEIYNEICQTHDVPLFQQYWWLEAVSAGKDWDVLLVYGEDLKSDEVVAALPYETQKRLWKHFVRPQEMSPYGGLWLSEEVRDNEDAIVRICKQIDEQAKVLKWASYNQRYGIESPVPGILAEMGYKIIDRKTYILDNLQDLDKIVEGFSRNKRKKLEKLTKEYQITALEPEEFYRFHVDTCAQKNTRIWYTREMLYVLYEKALEHQCGSLFGVRNEKGELLAEAFLVWDSETAYQLLNTFDHDYPDNGARELLTLEAIRRSRQQGVGLDFTYHRDYLKHYGAVKHTYYSVHKGSVPLVTLQRIIDWFRL